MSTPISVDLSTIDLWFKRAVPNPTDKNRAVQIGCHFEEFGEMCDTLCIGAKFEEAVRNIAYFFKTECAGIDLNHAISREVLLDALCDQIVTAVGVAHMFGMDIQGALTEVNRSNWSKFVDGQPVFNEHGKIAKGPNYTKPDLTPFA